uniref:Transcription cofactor vestigial-like protein 4 n=1 Tax=Balaenoptera musculus TaxID=9771 RepID=A0A8C0D035_BALMU
MLFMKMDLLNYQYLDKMNSNIGILCYEGEAALRGEPRLQTLPVASALTSHRTGPPPISPSKRKFTVEPGDDELDCESDHASKMSRIFAPHLNKTANGDCRKDPRERSRSPIERAVAPAVSLHGSHLYTSLPSLSMEQPLALTKNSLDAGRPAGLSPTLTPVERQQNRPSVITCASASARNCNLSHCPIAHSGCAAGPASYRRAPSSATTCDPVVEEHFRRSLGKNYKEPEPAPNSVSITGSVDDHFAKALGDTWLQIKAAKDGASSSPESALSQGPARQPLCPHGQPQPLPVCGLLKGAPPSNATSICMVCLSFEQSVLKKMEK